MYNVGFGDCFLVTVANDDRPRRILFDCGSIAADPAVSMDDVLERLWADATDEGADHPRIDVIVGTHRHRDHVSGFARRGWENVEVQEVWMPWTEDPRDPEAKEIRERQSSLALALEHALGSRLAAGGGPPDQRARLSLLQELAANALSNANAMNTLHEGFEGSPKRRFLPDGNDLCFDTPALPGVTVYVLGPSRDRNVIRDMDPPAGKSYLRLVDSLANGGEVPLPFAPEWQIDSDTWSQATAGLSIQVPNTPIARLLGLHSGLAEQTSPPSMSQEDRDKIASLGELDYGVAVSLDKAVNGTSLMLLLKIGARYLLFPGDAQWGSWQAALSNDEVRRLLEKTTFYKVGHHGSHNATPVEFVENVVRENGDVPAMISTRPIDKWPDIPREPLIEALTRRGCRCIRSDTQETATTGVFRVSGKTHIDLNIP
jgi:beta-lactamase superfamily II metal-dependent hydrolase